MDNNYINVFDIYENVDVTNNDVIVTITPIEGTSYYEYKVLNDEELVSEASISGSDTSKVYLTSSGHFKIYVSFYDFDNNVYNYESGIYKIDKEKPVIHLDKRRIEIKQNETIDILDGLTVTDNFDNDLDKYITTNIDSLDLSKTGNKELIYSVSDRAGNVSKMTSTIIIKENLSNYVLLINSGLILIFIIIFGLLLRYLRSVKLEKKISKYALEPINDKSFSLFDKFFNWYSNFISKLVPSFKKSVFLTKYSKHFEKYIGSVSNIHKDEMSFVVTKVIVGLIFLVIAIFSKTVFGKILSVYEIFIPVSIGFFVPDIIYFTKYKVYRSKVENDFLEAIIIMNNAFKSGRSIIQAIDLVASELTGPIAEEFKKMSLEISFGLAIEDVFKRFSKRINLPEVSYLTASLSILNKTGGNIIKVFSSIEKTLFNKKKLNLELKSLTGSSKIIVYILFVVPIAFVVFISVVDPSYFLPLLTTPLGFIITGVVIVVYIIYIIIVRKIMKVRM